MKIEEKYAILLKALMEISNLQPVDGSVSDSAVKIAKSALNRTKKP